LSGPAFQQLLAIVEQGHVSNVFVWRLDRLSRNLGDLILLADTLGKHEVGLHSFTEKLDLSSATGRMFYNILGAFAQFYREQLAENVRLGMHQAARQGKWVNRPKFGYDLVAGELVANSDAPTVRRIFDLRAQGLSYTRIEELTGVKYSTARAIAHSRIYLGEVLLNGEWFPGNHEPLVSGRRSRPRTEVLRLGTGGAATSSPDGCGADCAVGRRRSGTGARDAPCTGAGIGAQVAPSRPARPLDWSTPSSSGCVSSPRMWSCRRPSVAS
jgi:DNA invertase Pin-like site-specific DNA recombinase